MDDKPERQTNGAASPNSKIKPKTLSVEDRRVLDAILEKDAKDHFIGVSPKYLDRLKGKIRSLRKKICRVCRTR